MPEASNKRLRSPIQKKKKKNRRCHPCARNSASLAVLSRMQLTLSVTRRTPHGVSRSVQAMSAWSVQTRRAPSGIVGIRGVYGHTTTAMHDMSTPPSPRTRPVVRPNSRSPMARAVVSSYVHFCAPVLTTAHDNSSSSSSSSSSAYGGIS